MTHSQQKQTITVNEFCNMHSISRSMFYKLLKDGNAPRIMKVGRKTLISNDAAKEWQCAMEQLKNHN